MLRITPATLQDVFDMSFRLRGEDVRELETAMNMSARRSLFHAYSQSRVCFMAHSGTAPVAMFGVGPDPRDPKLGIIWMVGTDLLSEHARAIFRITPQWLKDFLRLYPHGLHALSDTRNTLHIRWLSRMGFQSLDTQELHGVPFTHVLYR